jgi:hypothetical protein
MSTGLSVAMPANPYLLQNFLEEPSSRPAIFQRHRRSGLVGRGTCTCGSLWCVGNAVRTPATAVAARILAIGFALRALGEFDYLGLSKSVRGTAFAYYDTWFYSPSLVCLAVICATASVDLIRRGPFRNVVIQEHTGSIRVTR